MKVKVYEYNIILILHIKIILHWPYQFVTYYDVFIFVINYVSFEKKQLKIHARILCKEKTMT